MADLTKICIRAEIDGKWESSTLKELFDMGEGGQVFEWALQKLTDLEEVPLTEDNLSAFVDLLEDFGVRIVKLK